MMMQVLSIILAALLLAALAFAALASHEKVQALRPTRRGRFPGA